MGHNGVIVMTVPFWQLEKMETLHMTSFIDLIGQLGYERLPLLPDEYTKLLTVRKSLAYSRDDQIVGREIYKLRLK